MLTNYFFILLSNMSQIPISRDSMRKLKAQNQIVDEHRKQKINQIVSVIYNSAIGTARLVEDSKYLYEVPNEFHKTNMVEILNRVQQLFPDCLVDYKTITFATSEDGKSYDISRIDEKTRRFFTKGLQIREYIIVDWS